MKHHTAITPLSRIEFAVYRTYPRVFECYFWLKHRPVVALIVFALFTVVALFALLTN